MTAFNRTINLVDCIKQTMGQIGLTEPSTVIGSTDRTVNSFWRLLNQAGKWLSMKYEWECLQREHVIPTVSPTLAYDLPTDWNGYIPDTSWNLTNTLPAIGSVPIQAWQAIKARSLSGQTITLLYKLFNNQVNFDHVNTASENISIWYNSRRWVVAADGITFKDECTANDDVIRFEPFMFISVLKWKWREARGFSTVAAMKEAMDAIAAVQGRDEPPVTLSVVPVNTYPFLGVQNIPDSGYGL
jgi:hypothetical protein